MKIEDIKVGMRIFDTWFSFHGQEPWGSGKVTKVLKTRVYIEFHPYNKLIYDKAHCQFLETYHEPS